MRDLTFLPEGLQSSAIRVTSGREVMWPFDRPCVPPAARWGDRVRRVSRPCRAGGRGERDRKAPRWAPSDTRWAWPPARRSWGEEYVERNLAQADDFNREFQEVVTEFWRGFGWGDETLTYRERSMINLGMIAALGRMDEWELHFRGAIENGPSRNELRAVLHQVTIYAGVPAGVECFRIARKVFAELDED